MLRSRVIALALLTPLAAMRAATGGDVVVSPEDKGVLIDKFFKDYKSSNNPNPSNSELDTLFIQEGHNGIRTPIYGTDSLPAHPSAGVVVGSYYDGHASTILKAKQRNPNLIVFASKKLDGDFSFPGWTKDANGVIPAQYAIMLADYIEHMAARGITIDVLGIDNERTFNEGNIIASRHKNIVDQLKGLAATRGFAMPLIIGHDDYGPRNSWMADLINGGWGDRLDIYGTHYYPHLRPISELKTDLAWAGSREKWHTELHWDDKEEDDMVEAEEAICALWDCTDNGMNGLMWWGYSRTGFKGSLMRQFSIPLIGAYPLAVDDVDGAGIATLRNLQTRAFLKGNQLTVYAVNRHSSNTYPNQLFRIESGRLLGLVSALQWTSTNQTAGTASNVVPLDTRSFRFTLPPRSFSSFTFTFAPSGLLARYLFEGNANDVSSNALHGTATGGVAYPPGREGHAAAFASAADTVTVPSTAFGDFLAGFWLKSSAASGPLVAGSDLALALSGSNVVFSIGTNSLVSHKPVSDGRWHHVAAERAAASGEMRLYVDGRLEAHRSGATGTLDETSLVLGGFAGLMDDVHFFDRTLRTNDFSGFHAPSVLLSNGGGMAEKGPVASWVALTQTPAGSDYPYIDLVEDDGSWLGGYSGTQARPIQVSDASDPFLAPHAGATFFKTTTGTWWRGRNKPQLDNLVVEAGAYSVSFFVGDGDTNTLFYSATNTSLPVSGNHVGLTATDPLAPVLPDMNSTGNSLLHKLDTNIVANFNVAAVPGDGEWVQWTIGYTVPANSPLIGRLLGFLFRKPAASDPQTTGAFDGPLVVDFTPAAPKAETLVDVQYNLAGGTATPDEDYNALPSSLSGTNSLVPIADLVAEGSEQLAIHLEPSPDYFIAGNAATTLAILDHPMDLWRASVFGSNAANPEIAGDAANPDGDALSNELEWALVTDPLVVDVPAMNSTISAPNFVISYERRLNSGFAIGASWSYSLTTPVWRTDGMIEVVVGQSGDIQTVAALVPLDGTQKFVRIGVAQP